MPFVNYNGLICIRDEALVSLHSRALRYGEGLIETMYFRNRKIRLLDLHYSRLKSGLETLNFPTWSIYEFEKEIAKTIIANQNPDKGILRAHFFMNEALYELQFWIEYLPIADFHDQWKKDGLRVGITASFVKSPDKISHLKHSSRLVYVMAKHEAVSNDLNDMLLTNPAGNIVESTISNIFLVKDKVIYTPPLSEGCVAGVMRQHILNQKEIAGFEIREKIIEPSFIADADEVFLTNAVRGIQLVHTIEDKVYTHDVTRNVYDFISAL
jgi:branched-subunit amino acid aminotransferase/4-amino-4-deoxychorismate lyase